MSDPDAGAMASDLVLYAGCLAATPFRELVHAAATAGFDAITIWPLMYRRAQSREGLDPATMRRLVDDAGLRVTDLDPCGDWLPAPPDDADVPTLFRSIWHRHDFFDAAAVLGAGCIAAVDLTGAPIEHDAAVEGFARLCDDAAVHGLRVALEFMPFSGVKDLSAAWHIVQEAGRANGGILFDVGHFARSGGGDDVLRSVPPERIFAVQLADGPAQPPDDLRDEAMYHRALPGEGELGVARILGLLAGRGVRTRVGPELYRPEWSQRPADVVAADLMAATRAVLGL